MEKFKAKSGCVHIAAKDAKIDNLGYCQTACGHWTKFSSALSSETKCTCKKCIKLEDKAAALVQKIKEHKK